MMDAIRYKITITKVNDTAIWSANHPKYLGEHNQKKNVYVFPCCCHVYSDFRCLCMWFLE